MRSRDSGLPLDSRNTKGTASNVYEGLPAQELLSSALFEISQNLASSSCGFQHDSCLLRAFSTREGWEPQTAKVSDVAAWAFNVTSRFLKPTVVGLPVTASHVPTDAPLATT